MAHNLNTLTFLYSHTCSKEEINSLKSKKFKPEVAFKLYDTYGFPVDMTESILNDKQISLDMRKYKSLVDLNKKTQKKSWVGNIINHSNKIYEDILKKIPETKFCGHEENYCDAKLLRITQNDEFVDSVKKCNENILIFDK